MMAVQKERDGNAEVTIPPCGRKEKWDIAVYNKRCYNRHRQCSVIAKIYVLRLYKDTAAASLRQMLQPIDGF